MLCTVCFVVAIPTLALSQGGLLSLFVPQSLQSLTGSNSGEPFLSGAAEGELSEVNAALQRLTGVNFGELVRLPNGNAPTAQNILAELTAQSNPINAAVQSLWQESIDVRRDYLSALATLVDAPPNALRAMSEDAEAQNNPIAAIVLRPAASFAQLLSVPTNLILRPAKAALDTEETFLGSQAPSDQGSEITGQQATGAPLRFIGNTWLNPIRLLAQPLKLAESFFGRAGRLVGGENPAPTNTEQIEEAEDDVPDEDEQMFKPVAKESQTAEETATGQSVQYSDEPYWKADTQVGLTAVPGLNEEGNGPPDEVKIEPRMEVLKERIKQQLRDKVMTAWAESLEKEFTLDD